MAECFLCGAETELYDGGNPVCIDCVDKLDEAKRTGIPASKPEQVPDDEPGVDPARSRKSK